MKQTVIIARPPVYDECAARFHVMPGDPVIFSWGDKIYNPEGIVIPPHLLAHEAVHGEQQEWAEGGVEGWWKNYLADDRFRYWEEVSAHHAEYAAYARRHANRKKREMALVAMVGRLSGPLYGHVADAATAREAILRPVRVVR